MEDDTFNDVRFAVIVIGAFFALRWAARRPNRVLWGLLILGLGTMFTGSGSFIWWLVAVLVALAFIKQRPQAAAAR